MASVASSAEIGQQTKYKGEWWDIMDSGVGRLMTAITLSNSVIFSVPNDRKIELRWED